MSNPLQQQYQLVQDARLALFDFCYTISNEDFVKTVEEFNNSSIKNLFVHIANVYLFWIGNNALRKELPFFKEESFCTMNEVQSLFEQVDTIVHNFLKHFNARLGEPIEITIARLGKTIHTTPLTIFTHVITHEFHHKGQILSMGRQHGYVPTDTDVIRF